MICMIFGKNMIFYCCHSARRAFARSCRIQLFLSRVNPFHLGKRSLTGRMRVLECRVVKLSPTVCDGPPSPNRRGVSSMVLYSATSPFGFAQNDKDGFSNDSEVHKKGLTMVMDILLHRLISYGEDLYTRTVRYIWPWGLLKSKKTLYL